MVFLTSKSAVTLLGFFGTFAKLIKLGFEKLAVNKKKVMSRNPRSTTGVISARTAFVLLLFLPLDYSLI